MRPKSSTGEAASVADRIIRLLAAHRIWERLPTSEDGDVSLIGRYPFEQGAMNCGDVSSTASFRQLRVAIVEDCKDAGYPVSEPRSSAPGIQLEWKPKGTLTGRWMVAAGGPVKSWALRMTRSLVARSWS